MEGERERAREYNSYKVQKIIKPKEMKRKF